MVYAKSVTFTLTDPAITGLALARAVIQAVTPNTFTAKEALVIAREFRDKGTWNVEDTFILRPTFEQGPWTCVVEKHGDPWEEHFRLAAEHHELLKRGAAGDVEAAIAYCKLELGNKVSHGAIG
jgi:hypothetical protein